MVKAHKTISKASRENLVERARALIPVLRAEAEAAEQRRAIAPESCYEMAMPRFDRAPHSYENAEVNRPDYSSKLNIYVNGHDKDNL